PHRSSNGRRSALLAIKRFAKKTKNEASAPKPRHRGQSQAGKDPYVAQMYQQITRAAEPRQKSSHGHGIEEWEMGALRRPMLRGMSLSGSMRGSMGRGVGRNAATMAGPVGCSMSQAAKMHVLWQVQMKMKTTQPTHEREHTEAEAHDKTNQKEQFPVHVKPRLSRPRSSLLAAGAR